MLHLEGYPKFSSNRAERPFSAQLADDYIGWSMVVRTQNVVELFFDEERKFCAFVKTSSTIDDILDVVYKSIDVFVSAKVIEAEQHNVDVQTLTSLYNAHSSTLQPIDLLYAATMPTSSMAKLLPPVEF